MQIWNREYWQGLWRPPGHRRPCRYNIALHAFNLLVAVNALFGAGQREREL